MTTKKKEIEYGDEFENSKPNWPVLIPILVVMAGLLLVAFIL